MSVYRNKKKVIQFMAMLLALLGLFGGFMSLGFWQLDRAQQTRELLADIQQKNKARPLTLPQLQGIAGNINYRRLQGRGHYLNQKYFLLDNQFHKRRLGYRVITPLRVKGQKRLVLVDRGWVPAGLHREDLPKILPYRASVHWVGIIYQPKKQLLLLGPQEDNPGHWPRVIQQLRMKAMGAALGETVFPFVVRLDQKQASVFVSEWKPVTMSPTKNQGYAFQWFSLAATAIILLLIMLCYNHKMLKGVKAS